MPYFDHFPRPGESDPYMLMIKLPPLPSLLYWVKRQVWRGAWDLLPKYVVTASLTRDGQKTTNVATIEGQKTNCTTDRHFNPLDDFLWNPICMILSDKSCNLSKSLPLYNSSNRQKDKNTKIQCPLNIFFLLMTFLILPVPIFLVSLSEQIWWKRISRRVT